MLTELDYHIRTAVPVHVLRHHHDRGSDAILLKPKNEVMRQQTAQILEFNGVHPHQLSLYLIQPLLT